MGVGVGVGRGGKGVRRGVLVQARVQGIREVSGTGQAQVQGGEQRRLDVLLRGAVS